MQTSTLTLMLLTSIWALGTQDRTFTVSIHGTGDFKSVQDAIMAVPQDANAAPWTILIKPGRYVERVYVQRERGNIILKGQDPNSTILTAGRGGALHMWYFWIHICQRSSGLRVGTIGAGRKGKAPPGLPSSTAPVQALDPMTACTGAASLRPNRRPRIPCRMSSEATTAGTQARG